MVKIYQKVGYVGLIVISLFFISLSQPTYQNLQDLLCKQKTYLTSVTKCSITFISCPHNMSQKFVKCSVNSCQRHLGLNECQRSLDFRLQQKQCYWECCKSNTFNQQSCQVFNTMLKQSRQAQDNFIILMLIIILACLFAFTLIFFFYVLRCKEDIKTLNEQNYEHQGINWKNSKYFDVKCQICSLYGSVIVTPCNHSYHLECFMKNIQQEVKCPKCPQKIVFNLKIVCSECRQKSFKVKVSRVAALKEIINEAAIQHTMMCQKGSKEVCTDVRLTSTGSSSD